MSDLVGNPEDRVSHVTANNQNFSNFPRILFYMHPIISSSSKWLSDHLLGEKLLSRFIVRSHCNFRLPFGFDDRI